jgi:lysyl oxidase
MLALAAAIVALAAPLPDLDQASPQGLSVVQRHHRRLLVFGSAVDNVGQGALVVEGRRVGGVMRAWQIVGRRRYRLAVPLRYVRSETHQHWHLTGFERYELRRTDGSLIGRDLKTGFCLRDAYETRALNRRPLWAGECGQGRPRASAVREGITPGFGDDYVPEKEGQSIDVTGLAPGRYVLVHRANPDRVLLERSYAKNAASVLFELRGRRVRLLLRCPDSARCGT